MPTPPRDLSPLLQACSVAIVGLSQPGSFGGQVYANLRAFGYPGPIYGVNPSYTRLYDQPCYPSLHDLPARPDCAILAIGNQHLLPTCESLVELGIPAAVIFSSAVLPAAPGEPTLDQRLTELALASGMRLCGPNGMGFANLSQRLAVSGYAIPAQLPRGNAALITHSGSVFAALHRNNRGLGFNYLISGGNESVLTLADYLQFVVDDPETQVVACFVEAVRDPERFTAALEQAATRDVPIVALKVGRSEQGQRLALAHSGRLAGQAEIYDALFRHYGVCSTRSPDELFDTIELFSRLKRRRAPAGTIASVHDSGGERVLLADLAEAEGLSFAPLADSTREQIAALLEPGLQAENPLDIWGSGKNYQQVYRECLLALDRDPGVGVLLFAVDLLRESWLNASYIDILRGLLDQLSKPFAVVANLTAGVDEAKAEALRALGVPVLMGAETALRAVRHLVEYSLRVKTEPRTISEQRTKNKEQRARTKNQEPRTENENRERAWESVGAIRESPSPVDPATRDVWRTRLADAHPLDEYEGARLLADYGIPTMAAALAGSLDEALAAAGQIGFPLALKTASGSAHKSDSGGVLLGLADEAALATAYRQLELTHGPRVLVQRMAPAGVELVIGVVNDAQFGLFLMLGLGGVFVEVLRDTRLLKLPADRQAIEAALASLRGAALLRGARGRPPAHIGALIDAAHRLGLLAEDLGDAITAIDVNPLIAYSDGVVAVDALVVPAGGI
jgi:acyl-CoA synthetase (NDP forming)